MAAFERGEVLLNYETAGKGERSAVVLLHGFTSDLRMWAPVARVVARARFVVSLDLRGHGRSSAPEEAAAYSMEVLAGDVAALLDELELERAAVVGCSFGGMVAQEFAVTWPERVSALVLSDTSPAYERPEYSDGFRDRERRIAWHEQVAARFGTAVLGKRLAASLPDPFAAEALRQRYGRLSPAGFVGTARARRERRDLTPLLRERLTMPVMLCWGEDDPVASARGVMVRELPAARVVMFRGTGHGVPAVAAEAFANALVTFLDDAEEGRPAGGSIEI